MRRRVPVFFIFLLLFLSACSGLVPTPLPTSTPTGTGTATPTIVWFPPSNTPTFFPSPVITPTQETLPGLGKILLTEDFSQPDLWPTAASPSASAVLDHNRLILSLSAPRLYLMTARTEPTLTDFYAQVTASLSLCRGKDAYGLLFHVMSNADYYRYSLNCNGQSRLERVRSGQVSSLQEWAASGDVPAGAPGEVKIGVWMAGVEMRFFLNDRYQFSVRDPVFRSGRLGLFALSGGDTSLVVSFSDLTVYLVSYVSPTPSLTPTATRAP